MSVKRCTSFFFEPRLLSEGSRVSGTLSWACSSPSIYPSSIMLLDYNCSFDLNWH